MTKDHNRNGVHKAGHGIDQIQMPDAQLSGFQQDQYNKGTSCRHRIAGKQNLLFVPAVTKRSGKDGKGRAEVPFYHLPGSKIDQTSLQNSIFRSAQYSF